MSSQITKFIEDQINRIYTHFALTYGPYMFCMYFFLNNNKFHFELGCCIHKEYYKRYA